MLRIHKRGGSTLDAAPACDPPDHDQSDCLICRRGGPPAYRPHTLTPNCWCQEPRRRIRLSDDCSIAPPVCWITEDFGMTSEDIEYRH